MRILVKATCLVAAVLVAIAASAPASAASFLWKKQLGTAADDSVRFLRGDADGNVVIAYQYSVGTPGSETWAYAIIKYGPTGKQLWRRAQSGDFLGLALDSSGNVYSIVGTASAGPMLQKYTAEGTVTWRRSAKTQYGDPVALTVDSAGHPITVFGGCAVCNAVSVVYYSQTGAISWKKRFVIANHTRLTISGVQSDANFNIIVSGNTTGTTQQDYLDDKIWIAKLTEGGVVSFVTVFSNVSLASISDVYVQGVAADRDDNIILAGWAAGDVDGLPYRCGGVYCAFLAKFGPDGGAQWTYVRNNATFGRSNSQVFNVTTDPNGVIYVSGIREVFPNPNIASWWIRPWVAAYSTDGTPSGEWYWPLATGQSNADATAGISVDGVGNLAIGGYTYGTLAGTYKGGIDGFVAKLQP